MYGERASVAARANTVEQVAHIQNADSFATFKRLKTYLFENPFNCIFPLMCIYLVFLLSVFCYCCRINNIKLQTH